MESVTFSEWSEKLEVIISRLMTKVKEVMNYMLHHSSPSLAGIQSVMCFHEQFICNL